MGRRGGFGQLPEHRRNVWRCDVRVLTGESLLVVLSHGDEIPQTGIELFHDGLQERERFVYKAELQHVFCAWVDGNP